MIEIPLVVAAVAMAVFETKATVSEVGAAFAKSAA